MYKVGHNHGRQNDKPFLGTKGGPPRLIFFMVPAVIAASSLGQSDAAILDRTSS
jgi:hypothetical protein